MSKQTSLPGTAPIGQGELAQRRADAPLRPAAPQRLMDFGLFGDERNQLDLVDLARGACLGKQ